MSYLILLKNEGKADLNNILREFGGLQVEKMNCIKSQIFINTRWKWWAAILKNHDRKT